jgi:hypothetical protein
MQTPLLLLLLLLRRAVGIAPPASRCRTCGTYAVLRMKLVLAGLPLSSSRPLRLPTLLRMAKMSMKVDLPAPDGPISACKAHTAQQRKACIAFSCLCAVCLGAYRSLATVSHTQASSCAAELDGVAGACTSQREMLLLVQLHNCCLMLPCARTWFTLVGVTSTSALSALLLLLWHTPQPWIAAVAAQPVASAAFPSAKSPRIQLMLMLLLLGLLAAC